MLQNAFLLTKIGADTAENLQHFAKNLRKTDNYPTGPLADRGTSIPDRENRAPDAGEGCARGCGHHPPVAGPEASYSPSRSGFFSHFYGESKKKRHPRIVKQSSVRSAKIVFVILVVL